MADELTLRDRANRLDWLRDTPDNIADAVDRHVRIDATVAWLNDMKADVRNWLTDQAVTIEEQTGGRFSVPVPGLAKVARSAPQPKPFVQDEEAFARWYVENLLDRDPDQEIGAGLAIQFDQYVSRRRVADAPSDALLRFLHAVADIDADGDTVDRPTTVGDVLDAVHDLMETIGVDDQWKVADVLLDHLLEGKAHPLQPSGRPSVRLESGALAVIDLITGERVPGIGVKPPGDPTLSVTPDPGVRKQLRAELDDLLGPPVLQR